MKQGLAIFLFFMIITDALGQFKPKGKQREIITDTVDLFSQFGKKYFKEKNSLHDNNNETQLIYSQSYNVPNLFDEEYQLTLSVIFNKLDQIELNKGYDLSKLNVDFELVAFFGGEYNKPTGRIKLIKKTRRKLTFSFDVSVLSMGKDCLYVFRGEREFKRE
jgi:hypothetical protein